MCSRRGGLQGTFRAGVRGQIGERRSDGVVKQPIGGQCVRVRPAATKSITGPQWTQIVTTKLMIQRRWSCREFGLAWIDGAGEFATDRRDLAAIFGRESFGND